MYVLSSGITRSLTLYGAAPSGGTPRGPSAEARGRTFAFDRVFGSQAANAEVFYELRPLARAVADGGRSTVLAYGQTGSGKT